MNSGVNWLNVGVFVVLKVLVLLVVLRGVHHFWVDGMSRVMLLTWLGELSDLYGGNGYICSDSKQHSKWSRIRD